MGWPSILADALLFLFLAGVVGMSGLGMMFTSDAKLRGVFTLAFLVALTMMLSVIYQKLT